MSLKTNAEWKYWGRRDPLWAVARFEGKSSGGTAAWTAEEFLALGASDFADVLRHWRHFGLRSGQVVEIGAGAGRMTRPLAETFDAVLALDVSADQIERARILLGPLAAKVRFAVVDDTTIPADDGSCAAMFTCHVLQHLPGLSAVAAYLRETHRVLASDGTICFHLPVPGAHLTSPQSGLWYAARNVYKRLKRALGIHAIAEYHRYPAARILRLLHRIGFVDAELRIIAMRSNGDYHSYFFARKP